MRGKDWWLKDPAGKATKWLVLRRKAPKLFLTVYLKNEK
jgi:hypothetical protein